LRFYCRPPDVTKINSVIARDASVGRTYGRCVAPEMILTVFEANSNMNLDNISLEFVSFFKVKMYIIILINIFFVESSQIKTNWTFLILK
jgi:hypothetical protein